MMHTSVAKVGRRVDARALRLLIGCTAEVLAHTGRHELKPLGSTLYIEARKRPLDGPTAAYPRSTVNDHSRGMSLLFRVRGRLCALPLGHVVETMRPLPVEAIAEAPAGVLGVAVIRGEPVAVIDVSALLVHGVDPAASESFARLVTVKVRNRTVALVVDSVVDVRSLPTESVRALPPLLRDADEDVVGALGTLDAELLFVLHTAQLVRQAREDEEVST